MFDSWCSGSVFTNRNAQARTQYDRSKICRVSCVIRVKEVCIDTRSHLSPSIGRQISSEQETYLHFYILVLDQPTYRRGPPCRTPIQVSIDTWKLHRSSNSRTRHTWQHRRKYHTNVHNEW